MPQTFSTTTSPMCTGAWIFAARMASMHWKIFPLGMSVLVRTLTRGALPPTTATVEVTVRSGAVTSFLP